MVAPRSAADIYAELAAAEQFLPASIQLSAAGGDPAAAARAKANYIAQTVRPAVEQAKADAGKTGANYGSFAGGLIGALESEGNRNAETASQDLVDRQIARWQAQRGLFMNPLGSILSDQTQRSGLFGTAFDNNRSFADKIGQRDSGGSGRLGSYLQAGFGALNELSPYLMSGAKWIGGKLFGGGGQGKTPIGVNPVSVPGASGPLWEGAPQMPV